MAKNEDFFKNFDRLDESVKIKKFISIELIDSRDWRSRLEMLWKYSTSVSNSISCSQNALENMSVDIEKNMERIETREKYLNGQLSVLLNQFSKKQEESKQIEDQYRHSSGNPFRIFASSFTAV